MSRTVSDVSIKWSDKSHKRDSQPGNGKNSFAARIAERIDILGTSPAAVARAAGIPSSTLSRYTTGQSLPNAEQIFPLADALKCSPRWLMQGQNDAPQLFDVSASDWVSLPLFDLLKFTDEGKPEPIGTIPLPRPWLKMVTGPSDKLWLTTVTATVGEWLREGEQIVCCDVEGDLVDGRLYIFMIDGHAIIRRAAIQPDGLQLSSGDPMTAPFLVKGDFHDAGIYPVARIAAAFRFAPF